MCIFFCGAPERDDSRTTVSKSANKPATEDEASVLKKMQKVKRANKEILKRVAERFVSKENDV